MRTNIDIDDELMADAMEVSGKTTKKDAVEEAMRQYTRTMRLKRFIAETAGIGWEGDLNEMRRDRAFGEDGWAYDPEK